MEYLMNFMIVLLTACIVGVAALLIFVFLYIGNHIRKESKEERNETCYWSQATVMDDYSTQCGNSFYDASESGNPVTDTLKYCPYCGGEIEQSKGE